MQQTSITRPAVTPSLDNATISLGQCVELLESLRLQVCEQITNYARPVAACDADFNTLLVERTEITAALAHLNLIYRGEAKVPHPREDLIAH